MLRWIVWAALPLLSACEPVAEDGVEPLRFDDPKSCADDYVKFTLREMLVDTVVQHMSAFAPSEMAEKNKAYLGTDRMAVAAVISLKMDREVKRLSCEALIVFKNQQPFNANQVKIAYDIAPDLAGDGFVLSLPENQSSEEALVTAIAADYSRWLSETEESANADEPEPAERVNANDETADMGVDSSEVPNDYTPNDVEITEVPPPE